MPILRHPATFAFGCSIWPSTFLSWSRVWQNAVKYKVRHQVGPGITHFIRWHYREYLMTNREKRDDLYVQGSFKWKTYVSCFVFPVLTNPSFAYVSNALFSQPSSWWMLYWIIHTRHGRKVSMAFLQQSWQSEVVYQANLTRFNHRMRKSVWRGVPFSLPVAVVTFVKAIDTKKNVAGTRCFSLLVFTEVIQSAEIELNRSNCLGWYNNDYKSRDVYEVPPAHYIIKSFFISKHRMRDGIEAMTFLHLI